MPKFLDTLVANAAYGFMAVGVIWLAIAVLSDSALLGWPVVACIAGGIMLREWPSGRLTWPWAVATAAMGFLLSAYQVYAWLSFLGGAFSTLAVVSIIGFALLAFLHVLLLYTATSKPAIAKAASE
ncbi:MAG TPA: hypothetical protein VEJ19_04695 [Nitrososphaerales archaeon]|nr:hypothetical protein [Nitrososphaerales archaeon]